jgi:hypothetical protein
MAIPSPPAMPRTHGHFELGGGAEGFFGGEGFVEVG